MRVAALALVGLLALGGCAGGKPAPEWESNAHLALANFQKAFLTGETRIADAEFGRARREVASTGRADLVARVELTRCAVQGASLDFDGCPGFAALAGDADARDRAYLDYIAGRWAGVDANLLPEQHRPVLASGPLPEQPLAKLIAAGALFRAGRIMPGSIDAAVDTASANGWRRPLLAWLGVQQRRASESGDREAAGRLRRRIELITPGGSK